VKQPFQSPEEFSFEQKMQDIFKSEEFKKASEVDQRQMLGEAIYDIVEKNVGN
jgi:hypothetical protein